MGFGSWKLGVAAVCVVTAACSDPDKERLKQTTKATYDQNTGRLKELTYDANKIISTNRAPWSADRRMATLGFRCASGVK